MTRWARGGVLAAVMTLGVLATVGEAAAFSRDRGFRSCFSFNLGILGDVDTVLQLAGERGPALQILGVVQFDTPGGPSLPVTGVALPADRRRPRRPLQLPADRGDDPGGGPHRGTAFRAELQLRIGCVRQPYGRRHGRRPPDIHGVDVWHGGLAVAARDGRVAGTPRMRSFLYRGHTLEVSARPSADGTRWRRCWKCGGPPSTLAGTSTRSSTSRPQPSVPAATLRPVLLSTAGSGSISASRKAGTWLRVRPDKHVDTM